MIIPPSGSLHSVLVILLRVLDSRVGSGTGCGLFPNEFNGWLGLIVALTLSLWLTLTQSLDLDRYLSLSLSVILGLNLGLGLCLGGWLVRQGGIIDPSA